MMKGMRDDKNTVKVQAFAVTSAIDTAANDTCGDAKFSEWSHYFCATDMAVTINGLPRTLPAYMPFAFTGTVTFNGVYELVVM